MTSLPFFQVDAFADRPLTGNPAAVMPLERWLDDATMQAIAAENNLSETAFTVPSGREDADYDLRWFTPTAEVQLCGHATLASAHVLWETGRADGPVSFHTRWKGRLDASHEHGGVIAMVFPSALSVEVAEPDGLRDALGAPIVRVACNDLHHVVEVQDGHAVRTLQPDIAALRAVTRKSAATS